MDTYNLTCGECGNINAIQGNQGDVEDWVCGLCGNENVSSLGMS